ncbi:hypothetical protein BpHYR1_052926 [Brachionus plicatilis]|uniref:Uncharacterized protein n=1 Tax=Brachionus plicatilis TaxID=10195 RepID=A0A3M7S9C6_BRAPC|nr:hypothetical protein BpHYR1_052926 [Brachionus plicatilis]
MVYDLSENDNSKEEKDNFSQKLFDSILKLSKKPSVMWAKFFKIKKRTNQVNDLINPYLITIKPETSTPDKNRSFDIQINTEKRSFKRDSNFLDNEKERKELKELIETLESDTKFLKKNKINSLVFRILSELEICNFAEI